MEKLEYGEDFISRNMNIMEAIANAGDITITGIEKLQLLEIRQRSVQMHDLDLTDIM
jgi:hypothetical protein